MGHRSVYTEYGIALGNSFQGVFPIGLGWLQLKALMGLGFIGLKADWLACQEALKVEVLSSCSGAQLL